MKHEKTTKHLKLIVILFACALGFFARSQSTATATQDRPARLFEIVAMDTPLEKRFGSDDGAVLAVHFAGDTRGSLDTCG